jgi:hypothetical protein
MRKQVGAEGNLSDVGEENGDEEVVGVYVKAFCQGVNSEVALVYKEHLLSIEHEYLQQRALTIPQVQLRLTVYFQLFPSLLSIMEEIEEQGLKGGQLLDAVAQRCLSGNPLIKALFTKILFYCNRVLFQQINGWIVHGQLIDLCEEFFIHKVNTSDAKKGDGAVDLSRGAGGINQSAALTSAASLSNLNLVGSILTMDGVDDEEGMRDDEWNAVYTLRVSMLPTSYFPPSLADKVIFIGKALRVLQSKRT